MAPSRAAPVAHPPIAALLRDPAVRHNVPLVRARVVNNGAIKVPVGKAPRDKISRVGFPAQHPNLCRPCVRPLVLRKIGHLRCPGPAAADFPDYAPTKAARLLARLPNGGFQIHSSTVPTRLKALYGFMASTQSPPPWPIHLAVFAVC